MGTFEINRNTPAPSGLHAVIHCDGSCPKNPGPMGIGYIITYERDFDSEFGTRFGNGSNNQAEYLALIWALRAALRSGVTHANVYMDSLLVVNQVCGRWACRDGLLKRFHEEAVGLWTMFSGGSLIHIPREENDAADFLSHNPTDAAVLPSILEISFTGKRVRKLSRHQAAMIRWWWATHRCRNEARLARIFGGTPSHMGKIGRGEGYRDITLKDLPSQEPPCTVTLNSQYGPPSPPCSQSPWRDVPLRDSATAQGASRITPS